MRIVKIYRLKADEFSKYLSLSVILTFNMTKIRDILFKVKIS